MPNTPTSEIQETEIILTTVGNKKKINNLLIFNCPHCNGTLGMRTSY